jgi:hypothetical protein
MKRITDLMNESKNHSIEDYDRYSKGLLGSLKNKDITDLIKGKALKKCAGYLIETAVKWYIQQYQFSDKEYEESARTIDDPDHKPLVNTFEDGETWYDFVMKGDKFEIKSFEKGKKYSNTKLTKGQVEHKDELIFVLCEYTVSSGDLKVTNIEFVEGKDLKINGNRLVKK